MPDIDFVLNFIENCKFILCNALDWKCQAVIQRQSKVCSSFFPIFLNFEMQV